VRKYYESPYRQGQKITVDEYYGWIFENSVPGLPAEAKKHGMTPLEYMRRHGAFLVEEHPRTGTRRSSRKADLEARRASTRRRDSVRKSGKPIGVAVAGRPHASRSRRRAASSSSSSRRSVDWGWPEYALPAYIESHVHRKHLDPREGRVRARADRSALPTLIHTRSGQLEVALRALEHEPGLDPSPRTRAASASRRWTSCASRRASGTS
jgi:hypothetical protein